MIGTLHKLSYCIIRIPATLEKQPWPHPRSTCTPTEERREARLEGYRKYYKANREAITGRRKKAYKTKRAVINAAQKETLAGR